MNKPSPAPETWNRLVDGLNDYLVLSREAGVVSLMAAKAPPHRPPPAETDGSPPPVKPSPEEALGALAGRIAGCERCTLCRSRTKTVPGQGNPRPELVFVGEGPGADEDRQGLAFVGKAGQLLTRMILAMGFTREDVFIANVVKCRPPENRTPLPDEAEACLPFLEAQLEILQPKVIVALGATPLKALLGNPRAGITRMRGTWTSYQGFDLMPTFHPSYLLRKPEAKHDTWADLKEVLVRLGRPLPGPAGPVSP